MPSQTPEPRSRGRISFVEADALRAATPPAENSTSTSFSNSTSGREKKGSTFGKSSGGYGDALEGSASLSASKDSLSASARVMQLKDTSVTQRFNIFQERRSRGSTASSKTEEQQEKMNESILASRKAMKKVSKVFDRASHICNDLFNKAMARRGNEEAEIRVHVDEYVKMCLNRSKESDSHNLHFRFCTAVDDIRTLRFDLSGVIEQNKEISDRTGSILGEIYARVCSVAGSIIRDQCPTEVNKCSSRSYLDTAFGLVIQQWDNHEAVKQYGKSLSRFLNFGQSVFHTPCFVSIECAGRPFTAMTMVPLAHVLQHPQEDPWISYYIEKCICETHFPIDKVKLIQQCRFGYGYDGRLYCVQADGLVPKGYSDEFLEDYEGEADPVTMTSMFMRTVEQTCTELTAVSRANVCEVSKIMHRQGLSLQYIHFIHSYLSRTEQTREQSNNSAEDHNLVDALRAVISEILSRVLKIIIREYWMSIEPGDDAVMAKEMAAFASQLVFSQIIDGLTEAEQLYMVTSKLSQKLYLSNKKAKFLIWEEYFVSEEQISARVARFLGLAATSGVLAMTTPYRFVRGTQVKLSQRRIAIVRGKHREVLQKLVSRIKSSRAFSPHHTNALTYALADIFHQASTRSGVTNTPVQVYTQILGTKRDDDDDNRDDFEIKTLLAQQAVYLHAAKRITARDAVQVLVSFLEKSISLAKVCPPEVAPFFMAIRVRILAMYSKYINEPQVLGQLESCIQTLDNQSRKAANFDPRHANWMWRLLYNGLAAGKAATDPDKSVEIMRQKLEQNIRTFGENSLQVVGCITDVATQLSDLGRLEEAEAEFSKAQAALQQLDSLNRMSFTTANNLGVTYFMMANKKCPSELKKRRTTFLKVVLPPDVVDYLLRATEQFKFVIVNRQHAELKQIADALNNLGSVNLFRMKYGDAIVCFEDSLALTREHYADDHPDRVNASKNLKTCEKSMRQKAAILIGCWVKRARAKAQLSLLKKGANHVKLFQRCGRAMFVRLQLHRHAEKRRIKMMQQQRIAAATAAAAAKQQARQQQQLEQQKRREEAELAAAHLLEEEENTMPITDAAQLLQNVGRGYLQRNMIGELRAMKSRRKSKKK